jgi:hypothetical protein
MYRNTDADLIGFLDADDEYLPEHLLYSVEMLARSRGTLCGRSIDRSFPRARSR